MFAAEAKGQTTTTLKLPKGLSGGVIFKGKTTSNPPEIHGSGYLVETKHRMIIGQMSCNNTKHLNNDYISINDDEIVIHGDTMKAIRNAIDQLMNR